MRIYCKCLNMNVTDCTTCNKNELVNKLKQIDMINELKDLEMELENFSGDKRSKEYKVLKETVESLRDALNSPEEDATEISSTEQRRINEIYYNVSGIQKRSTSCSPCVVKVVKSLEIYFNQYNKIQ